MLASFIRFMLMLPRWTHAKLERASASFCDGGVTVGATVVSIVLVGDVNTRFLAVCLALGDLLGGIIDNRMALYERQDRREGECDEDSCER